MLGNNSETPISKASKEGDHCQGISTLPDSFFFPSDLRLNSHTKKWWFWFPSPQNLDRILNVCEVSSSKEKLLTHSS